MASRKKRFHYQSLHDNKSIADVLEAVTSGLAKGKVVLSDGDEKIVMKPDGLMHLRVKASQEDDRNRISISVSWQPESPGPGKKKSLSVK